MASIQRPTGVAALLQNPIPPSASEAVRDLFSRVFTASLRPLLAKPDHIKERIDNDRYITHLFFSDAEQKELAAMYSIDKQTFTCAGIEGAMRVHFLHTNGTPGLQKPLLLKAVAHAIGKRARAIIFLVTPAAGGIHRLLKELNFVKHQQVEKYQIMVHKDPSALKAQLEAKPLPPPPPPAGRAAAAASPPPPPAGKAAAAPPLPADMPLPRVYKSVTLMKRYLHMIRNGYRTRDGIVYKTVEGRINRGMFAKHNLPVGSGLRFFYQQNRDDDVQCTILGIRTFQTFREMLAHYGYEKLVPDVPNLDAAVAAYARIPGYSQKERESGVIGIELRVDGHGPDGPAHRSTQPATPRPVRRDPPPPMGSRKRRSDDYSSHYRGDPGNGHHSKYCRDDDGQRYYRHDRHY